MQIIIFVWILIKIVVVEFLVQTNHVIFVYLDLYAWTRGIRIARYIESGLQLCFGFKVIYRSVILECINVCVCVSLSLSLYIYIYIYISDIDTERTESPHVRTCSSA